MTNNAFSFCKKHLIFILLLWITCLQPARSMTIDENCTINILNRSVQANEDGSWSMPNVPSFGIDKLTFEAVKL